MAKTRGDGYVLPRMRHPMMMMKMMKAWQLYNGDMYCHKDDNNAICELLAVKHGDLELDFYSNSVSDAFIEFLRPKKKSV